MVGAFTDLCHRLNAAVTASAMCASVACLCRYRLLAFALAARSDRRFTPRGTTHCHDSGVRQERSSRHPQTAQQAY